MKPKNRGQIAIRHTMRLDLDKTPPIRLRQQICPLLAGLNRMGCRGPHCQWWIPYGNAEEGDCAMVLLALRDHLPFSDALVSVLTEKQRMIAEWHGQMGRMRVPVGPVGTGGEAEEGAPGLAEAAARGPESTEEEPAIRREGNSKLARTHRGMTLAEIEELWGEPQEVRHELNQPCYIYPLPEGGRVYLMFRGETLARIAKW